MKRALITGGSGDIGEAICKRLAYAGLFVYVHANSRLQRAQQIVDEIKNNGGMAEAVSFDITDSKATKIALEGLLTQDPIQIVINNAGMHDDAIMAGMKLEQWQKVIDINLNGFFNVTQPLLMPMMKTRWGRIVSMSSIAGVMGNRGQANYAAAKSGLHGASKSLANEIASRGITVNVVAPGIVAGSMTENIFDEDSIKKMVPMQRAAQADEIAALVNFLVSDDAAYITGQVININGGMV